MKYKITSTHRENRKYFNNELFSSKKQVCKALLNYHQDTNLNIDYEEELYKNNKIKECLTSLKKLYDWKITQIEINTEDVIDVIPEVISEVILDKKYDIYEFPHLWEKTQKGRREYEECVKMILDEKEHNIKQILENKYELSKEAVNEGFKEYEEMLK